MGGVSESGPSAYPCVGMEGGGIRIRKCTRGTEHEWMGHSRCLVRTHLCRGSSRFVFFLGYIYVWWSICVEYMCWCYGT